MDSNHRPVAKHQLRAQVRPITEILDRAAAGLPRSLLRALVGRAYSAAYDQHQLVGIYLLVGEPEKALDQLEPLLKMPYDLSPGWLGIDPTFAPLKENPRFERLGAGR